MDGRDVWSLLFISQGHDYLWLLGTHFFPHHYAQEVLVFVCLFVLPHAQFHCDSLLFPYIADHITAFLCHFYFLSNRLFLLLLALPDTFHSQTVDEGCLLKTHSTHLFGFWLVITWKNSTTEQALVGWCAPTSLPLSRLPYLLHSLLLAWKSNSEGLPYPSPVGGILFISSSSLFPRERGRSPELSL